MDGKMKKNKSKRMTEEDLKKILKNKNLKVTVNGNQNKTFKDMIIEDNEKKVSSSTENIRVKIISSLQNCDITIDGSNEPGKEFISIWFNGARIMTLNEMLRTIQVQKYELFRYKKEWQKLMSRAILMLPKEKRPFFENECSFTLFRQGKRLIDLDGFQAAFKYAIDALCYENILSEDNPNIMHETKSIQSKGNSYICGLRIEKIEKTKEKTSEEIFKDWFS
jgi:hypothetical protein